MRLENKVAMISGGARGMGAVEANVFQRVVDYPDGLADEQSSLILRNW